MTHEEPDMKKKKKVKWIPNYSGHRSIPFWHYINSQSWSKRKHWYLLGVLLQDLEGKILKEINEEL